MYGRKLGALAGAVALVLGLAACGDDDDEESTATTEAAEETTTTAAEEETTTTAAAEEEGEGEEGGPPEANPCAPGESGELAPATPPADGATELAVTATEYAFEGLDITATGEYAISLTNGGNELHELVLVKLLDEETPLEELLASEEEPAMEEVAFTFACPGATGETTAAS